MTMNCIVVDDEPLALDLIEDNIKKISFLKLIKKCKSATEALKIVNSEKIDLIFLDIQMPDISGIQFIKSLKNKPMVILITAFEKYALEGFELDVIDYLLKPVPFERFLKAVNKAHEYYNFINIKPQANDNLEPFKKYIFVKSEHKIIKINTEDILFIEGLKDYVKIYIGEKPIFTLQSLKFFEDKLSCYFTNETYDLKQKILLFFLKEKEELFFKANQELFKSNQVDLLGILLNHIVERIHGRTNY